MYILFGSLVRKKNEKVRDIIPTVMTIPHIDFWLSSSQKRILNNIMLILDHLKTVMPISRLANMKKTTHIIQNFILILC
jgi:hypothetical protein